MVRKQLNLLREFSVPLLAGVIAALTWANSDPEGYRRFLEFPLVGGLGFHFLTNDVFMVFFFAIAAVELTRSFQPGGDLSPVSRAANPLLATVGGVIGPALVYLLLNRFFGMPGLERGWGIPTATDIAFAWLTARMVFGIRHPAIAFLLLLAIVDDGIGLAIIAIFYPDPLVPVVPLWLVLTASGMLAAYGLRRMRIRSYWPTVLLGGGLSWAGLHQAHLHPALALVFVVPFLSRTGRDHKHLFEEDPSDLSSLARFEHEWKVVVDFGLFFFGLANAGVQFGSMGTPTWLVLGSLLGGKCLGIVSFGLLARRFGFPLPAGMGRRTLVLVGIIAGFGFTVALFLAGEAFADPAQQAAARMGAMLSVISAPVALILAKVLKIRKKE